jgi:hypothetical protein
VFWLTPAAWWGLAVVAAPIVIHLLVRHQSRRVAFPSLRFLRSTPLAALRRRLISDWALLAVRIAILVCAVAALAGPVFVSASRRASWQERTARAIVVFPSPAHGTEITRQIDDERRTSFTSEIFDNVADASLWLTTPPPAAREVVIVGNLRHGSLRQSDVDALPPYVGIRFLPFAGESLTARTRLQGIAAVGDMSAAPYDLDVELNQTQTRLRYQTSAEIARRIELLVPDSDQDHAEAVLRAVFAEGVLLGRSTTRRVSVVFQGAAEGAAAVHTRPASTLWMRTALERLPDLRGGERDGTLVVVAGIAVTNSDAAALVARVAHVVFGDLPDDLEPVPIPASVLAQWSRPPGPLPETTLPADEGDRRWLWGAALGLMLVESVVRRSRLHANDVHVAAEQPVEARIA